MSLSKRGYIRASIVAPGGALHAFYRGITHEWRSDFIEGTSQLDTSENELMEKEMSIVLKALLTTSSDNWLSPHGPLTPSASEKLLSSCSTVINVFFCPHTPVQPSQLVAGAGCSLLLEAVARVVCDPKDVILTPGPIWPIFNILFAKAEVSLSVVLPTLTDEEGPVSIENALKEMNSLLDWTEETEHTWERHFSQLVKDGKQARAMLLSNPQNPLGRCYSRSFLVHALEFCEKHDLFFISDEVFALSEHQDPAHENSIHRFQSILSIDLNTVKCNPARVIVLWSVAKDFGASGARLAVVVTPPSNIPIKSALLSLATSFRISSLTDSFFAEFFIANMNTTLLESLLSTARTPILETLPAHGDSKLSLSDVKGSLLSWYVQENRRRLADAKQRFQTWCSRRGIAYLEADAGHFLMLYLGPWLDRRIPDGTVHSRKALEQAFHMHLLSHNVALQPGLPARCPRAGWFRATFSREYSYMDEALSRLDFALNSW